MYDPDKMKVGRLQAVVADSYLSPTSMHGMDKQDERKERKVEMMVRLDGVRLKKTS